MTLDFENSMQKKLNVVVLCFFAALIAVEFSLMLPVVRDIIISLSEKLIFHRPLNHEKCFERVILGIIVTVLLVIYKIFSLWFSLKVHNSFLNLIRSIACLMVYILHVSLSTNSRGVPLFTRYYTRVFETPAWGGVWLFFILGGYLAGKGFLEGRYGFDMKSVCKYYSNKFFKIIVPTFSFIFLCCVLVYPSFIKTNPIALFRFLTFSYNGNPGVSGIGATWYVFTLVPLYLLAPVFSFLAGKIAQKQWVLYCFSMCLLAAGFSYRFFAVRFGFDWYSVVYAPFYANIDLFFGGVLLSQIAQNSAKKLNAPIFKDISLFLLVAFILINSIFYEKFFFYQVFCPSIYILLGGFALVSYSDESWSKKYDSIFAKTLAAFSSVTFEFYLFHSLVLRTILPAFSEKNVLRLHFELLAGGFVLSLICSVGFKRIFAGSKTPKLEKKI